MASHLIGQNNVRNTDLARSTSLTSATSCHSKKHQENTMTIDSIKYLIAYLPARTLFFAGDIVSKLPSFESSLDNEDHFSSATPLKPEFIWSLYQ